MTIVQTIETMTQWLNKNVCPKVVLKEPSDENAGTGYKLKRVSPTAFSMFIPTKDKLPSKIKNIAPSITVQLVEGNHNFPGQDGRYKLQLTCIAWNPGTTKSEGAAEFERTTEGWKDVWELIDRIIAEVENVEYMDGLRLVKELGVTFGQFSEDGQISDFYPYFMGYIIFTVENSIPRSQKTIGKFL